MSSSEGTDQIREWETLTEVREDFSPLIEEMGNISLEEEDGGVGMDSQAKASNKRKATSPVSPKKTPDAGKSGQGSKRTHSRSARRKRRRAAAVRAAEGGVEATGTPIRPGGSPPARNVLKGIIAAALARKNVDFFHAVQWRTG